LAAYNIEAMRQGVVACIMACRGERSHALLDRGYIPPNVCAGCKSFISGMFSVLRGDTYYLVCPNCWDAVISRREDRTLTLKPRRAITTICGGANSYVCAEPYLGAPTCKVCVRILSSGKVRFGTTLIRPGIYMEVNGELLPSV
jgi:hypothetical protein